MKQAYNVLSYYKETQQENKILLIWKQLSKEAPLLNCFQISSILFSCWVSALNFKQKQALKIKFYKN